MGDGHVVERAVGDTGHLGRVVGQGGVLADAVDHVGPESVDSPVEPEPEGVVHGLDHRRLVPVEVGLGRLEQVEVPLAGRLVEGPRRCGQVERGHPVVGGEPSGCGSRHTYQLRWALSRDEAASRNQGCWSEVWLGTQSMTTRRPSAWASADQGVELRQVAEERVDVAVVADVVAEVGHGRAEERGDPQGVDAQPGQVVEVGPDAGQVADPVAVGVGEATGGRPGRRPPPSTTGRRRCSPAVRAVRPGGAAVDGAGASGDVTNPVSPTPFRSSCPRVSVSARICRWISAGPGATTADRWIGTPPAETPAARYKESGGMVERRMVEDGSMLAEGLSGACRPSPSGPAGSASSRRARCTSPATTAPTGAPSTRARPPPAAPTTPRCAPAAAAATRRRRNSSARPPDRVRPRAAVGDHLARRLGTLPR